MKKIFLIIGMLVVFSMAGTMKDSRDGKTYKTVKIGEQVWMAENLNVNVPGSVCYDNDPANCEKYGRLYTWKAAMEACPAGWHLPSGESFKTLLKNVGFSDDERWMNLYARAWEGTDKYGFSALPAGRYDSYDKSFNDLGEAAGAAFWSSTDKGDAAAFMNLLGMGYVIGIIASVEAGNKPNGYSVRCLLNSNEGHVTSSQRSKTQPSNAVINEFQTSKTFKTVKIGNQTWMAENLSVEIGASWSYGESRCYDYNDDNCKKYGRLYTSVGCPSGWHLPSKKEFNTLLKKVGSTGKERSKNLRATNWGNGADKFGFSALPAGSFLGAPYYSFGGLDNEALFISSTEENICDDDIEHSDCFLSCYLRIRDNDAFIDCGEYLGGSVRCLKD